jgi:hypothetical protein
MVKLRRLGLGVLCLGGLLMSCDPGPVNHLSWTPLSEDEVQARLASPTGPLFEAEHQQVVNHVRDRLPALLEATRFLAHIVNVVSEVSETDYSDVEAKLPEVEEGPSPTADSTWGSSFYLRVACWGKDPVLGPVKDFTAGEVRLDSPELKSLELSSLIRGGEFLLSFRKCELGPLLMDAALRGRYMVDLTELETVGGTDARPNIGLALSTDTIDYQGHPGPLGLLAIGCGGEGGCGDDVRTVAELKTEAGSYLVSFRALRSYWTQPGELAVTLRGRNSASNCSYVSGPGYTQPSLTCSTP